MLRKSLALIIISVSLCGCASTSESWIEKRVVKDKLNKPILIDGKPQIVEVSIVKHKGNIKAEHPNGAKGENSPLIQLPSPPPIKYEG